MGVMHGRRKQDSETAAAPSRRLRVLPCFFLWARGLACTPLRYMGHALESLGGPVFSRPAYRARVAGAGELYSKKAGATPLNNGPRWLPQEPSTRRKGRGEAGVGRTCRRPGWAPGVQTAAARVYRGQLVTSVSRGPMQGRGGRNVEEKWEIEDGVPLRTSSGKVI